MSIYIAQFTATHKIVQIAQSSIFIWQQESGEIDLEMLKVKIARESAIHFFGLVAGTTYPLVLRDITIQILKTEPFRG